MTNRVPCVVLGPGNIGTDLMSKLLRSSVLELTALVGIDPQSDGLQKARARGLDASDEGVDWILQHQDQATFVFDATSARAHRSSAPKLIAAGLRLVDLTPAKLGPGIVPAVNLADHHDAPDVNLISCGGQATIPVVAAVARVTKVPYSEIVATVASAAAGPGTRQNIDEFTRTTAKGLEDIGGAERGKAIIILSPAEPPILMRNTIYCSIPPDADQAALDRSIREMVAEVARYVPGYRLKADPVFDEGRVAIFIEVEGQGDYLPKYAGNLDIMTAAAVRVGEEFALSHMRRTA
ncbi:MAG: acetaldehyde dehydrogenase (acetylating) [Candidatus Dormibacteraceae bacterium]